MKKYLLAFLVVLIAKFILAEQPWFYYYKLGIENFNNNQYQLALNALDKAIELNPHSSSKARTYGMNFIEYYPYYYKAMCLFALKINDEAKKTLEYEFKQNEIQNSKSIYNKALILKEKIDSEFNRIPSHEVQQKTNNITKNESNNTNIISSNEQTSVLNDSVNERKEKANDLFENEIFILREAITNYFNGEYEIVIKKLNSLPDNLPPRMKYIKNFFLGCSYASIYYLEGEKNKENLQLANSYFNKVGTLPPFFRNNLPKLISPKILSKFMETR